MSIDTATLNLFGKPDSSDLALIASREEILRPNNALEYFSSWFDFGLS